jgi:hypothetical protein
LYYKVFFAKLARQLPILGLDPMASKVLASLGLGRRVEDESALADDNLLAALNLQNLAGPDGGAAPLRRHHDLPGLAGTGTKNILNGTTPPGMHKAKNNNFKIDPVAAVPYHGAVDSEQIGKKSYPKL